MSTLLEELSEKALSLSIEERAQFAQELLAPGEEVFVVAPWISNIVVFDNRANRSSSFDEKNILTLRAKKAPLPLAISSALPPRPRMQGTPITIASSATRPKASLQLGITKRSSAAITSGTRDGSTWRTHTRGPHACCRR